MRRRFPFLQAGIVILAFTILILGMSVGSRDSAWAMLMGVAILLLAAALMGRQVERKAAGRKVSNSLVTLSSAAILAVYAAGYERTGPAADRFAHQTDQRRSAAPVATSVAPEAMPAAIEEKHTLSRSSASRAVDRVAPAPTTFPTLPSSTPAEPPPMASLPPAIENPTAPEPPFTSAPTNEAAAASSNEPSVQPQSRLRDGTYLGWGYSRHGDIQAFVVIQGGRIASAGIEQCLTRYSCSWIDQLPGQVVSRQSPNVDYVSGATQSADAFYGAVVEALSKAK